jgi:hypothetical protein
MGIIGPHSPLFPGSSQKLRIENNMKLSLLDVIALSSFAIPAILTIFFPKKLQNYYINYCANRKYMHPFLGFAKSKLFIINCMICGFLLLFMFAVLLLGRIYGIQR